MSGKYTACPSNTFSIFCVKLFVALVPMKKLKQVFALLCFVFVGIQCQSQTTSSTTLKKMKNPDSSKINKTDEEWKKILTNEVYYIARMKGTERPWTSKYENFYDKGTYACAACGNHLFQSDTKFNSGCGWPSFFEPITKSSIIYTPDNSHGMKRTEVQCGKCNAHLGHLFEDGPPPTGLRYCINGVILDFTKSNK